MTSQNAQKPAYDEWMYWTQVVIDRLTTVIHVYSKPPYSDIFMPEYVKQARISETADLVRMLHTLTDENDLNQSLADRNTKDEQIIYDLQAMLKSVLRLLPTLSRDMQQLLRSPWMEDCAGKVATVLFCGPQGRQMEGIGSGMSVHGRLPEQLENMLEREVMGDSRPMRQEASPKTQTNDREDVARNWRRQNNAYLRTAGRID